jgi:glycosyltransferase involved in cell wall biosynthesis
VTRVLFPLTEPLLPEKARFVAIVHTAAALARAGVAVTLIMPGPQDAVARYAEGRLGLELPSGLEVVRISGWHRALGHPVTWNRIAIRSALGAIASRRGGAKTLVHLRHEKLALALSDRSRRAGAVPFVFEAHTIAADYERECGRSARRVARADERSRRILDGAAALVTISEGLKDEIVRRYRFTRPVAVARSAVDLERFPYSWRARDGRRPDGPRRIVYVGRLGAWKAVGTLVEALGKVPEAHLVLVGAGDGDAGARLRDAARSAGAESRMEIVGHVDHRTVASIIATADVAVHALPADLSIAARDTSPLKLLEYLAVGVPVVAPDLPSIREIVEDGRSAVLVRPGDPEALAAAIRRLLSDPGLASRLSAAGRAVAERNGWDARARTMTALYDAVLPEASP